MHLTLINTVYIHTKHYTHTYIDKYDIVIHNYWILTKCRHDK